MQSVLLGIFMILLEGCGGPFRPPSFDKSVTAEAKDIVCITRIKGGWPNLPHNPMEWFVGGRTDLSVEVHSPKGSGKYDAD
jgi:hypothetical protein